MSLKLVRAFDLAAFSQAVLTASGLPTTGTIIGNSNEGFAGGDLTYLQARDVLVSTGVSSTLLPRGLRFRLDPDLALPSASLAHQGADVARTLIPGQYNPATGQQRLYGVGPSGANLQELNVDTLVASGGPAFVGPNGAFRHDAAAHLITPAEGFWFAPYKRGLLFESLTDGIPGETLAVGPGVYPWGLYWAPCSSYKLNGVETNDAWGWIDVYTTACVGRPGGLSITAFPRLVSASVGTQTEAPIAGDAFIWGLGSFTLDADASAAAPKGEIFAYANFAIGASATPPVGQVARVYVRWWDFNPFHLPSSAGVPTRTHGRIRLTSRVLLPLNPQFGIAGQSYFASASANPTALAYDSLRRRVLATAHRQFAPGAAMHSMGWYARAVDPVILTAPAARSVPRTADVATFESFVGGDLSEPAAGQVVNFTLARRSTEGELVAVTGGAGSTSTLGYPPIDTDALGVAALALVADGVPLGLGVAYTVVAATGVLTWVTSQAGKTVLASYRHRQTDALPAHGTLLLGTAQGDEFGRVRTDVAYPDDDALVGAIDAITAVLG